MPLYKPGKEHTINFIYCWAAGTWSLSALLPLILKGWRDSSLGSGRVKRRVGLDHSPDPGGSPRNGVAISGPLFLPAVPHSPVHLAQGFFAGRDPALQRR